MEFFASAFWDGLPMAADNHDAESVLVLVVLPGSDRLQSCSPTQDLGRR